MDFKPLVLGLLFVGSGLALAVFGPTYVQASVANHEIGALIPESTFVVGDLQEISRNLEKGITITVTLDSKVATSNSAGALDFYVFNEVSFTEWSSGETTSAIVSKPKVATLNETFNVTESGTYHFVFDNRASLEKKRVTFESRFDRLVYVMEPDERVAYVAYATLVVGAIFTAYGIIRKPPIPWA
jgi:hypothetical protein